MDFEQLITVSGKPDLFLILNKKVEGIIVRSLDTKKVSFFSTWKNKISTLNNIEIFSKKDALILLNVFKMMEASKEPLPENLENEELLNQYYKKINEDMDTDKISFKDKKRIIQWFKTIKANNIKLK